MMLDPHADLGRRAWLPCPSCGTTPVYLLDCDINLIWGAMRHLPAPLVARHRSRPTQRPAHLFDVA